MYPPEYGVSSLSYAEKFDSILHFFIPKEKVRIRERIVKKLIEVDQRRWLKRKKDGKSGGCRLLFK
jgi:hypothetical protein